MLDDIGIGSTIANLIYLLFILLALFGGIYYISKKRILKAMFIVSTILNLVSIFYFMGFYYQHRYLYTINYRIWPIINVILFLYLITNFIKNKHAKTNKN